MPIFNEYSYTEATEGGPTLKGRALRIQPAKGLMVVAEKSEEGSRSLYWTTELTPHLYFNLARRVIDLRNSFYVITRKNNPDPEVSLYISDSDKSLETIKAPDASDQVYVLWERALEPGHSYEAGVVAAHPRISGEQMLLLAKLSGKGAIAETLPHLADKIRPLLTAN